MLMCKLSPSETPITLETSLAMLQCMKKYMALGLAANQVGYPFRIITVAPNLVMIEPEILEVMGYLIDDKEACLSLPNVICKVKRAVQQITVRYLDMNNILREHNFSGMTARVIQHEIDHLNGVLITDKGTVLEA